MAFVFGGKIAHSQELAKLVFSPKALQLKGEWDRIGQENKSLSTVYYQMRDEFLRLMKEGTEKNDLSQYTKFSKERRAEYNALKRKIDSVTNLLEPAVTAYFTEIKKTKESQVILKQMKEAKMPETTGGI